MVLKESNNILELVDCLKGITYWCNGITKIFTNDKEFIENIKEYYNNISEEERQELFNKLQDIQSIVHKQWLELDKIEEDMNEAGFGF